MKTYHLIGNLKMNPVSRDAVDRYLDMLRHEFVDGLPEGVAITVAAPFPYLERFASGLPEGVGLAAQDVFWEGEGAYTGEVSSAMLRDLGVSSVLVGHSERRRYARESDDDIAKKAAAAAEAGLGVVLCVGETAEERASGREADAVAEQLGAALSGVPSVHARRIVVAYEPRWAIGTDRVPTPEEILSVRIVIRRAVAERFGHDTAEAVPVLYGGSVRAVSLPETCFDAAMDGVLVGRESLVPDEFGRMACALSERATAGGTVPDIDRI